MQLAYAEPPVAQAAISQLVCAVYLRYSSDEQRPTSIEDQLRRCRETAARLGLTIDERRTYIDTAVTGKDSGLHKRHGYQAMKQAAEDGMFGVLIVDEFSRLSRDMLEGSVLAQTFVRARIRLVTADGLDTQQPHWRMPWMFKAFTAEHELEQMVFRIKRGTEGQLQRGYQVGPPPYGYRVAGQAKGKGESVGSRWEIVEAEAEVVRSIYAARAQGKSCSRIADDLQRRGVPPRGVGRKGGSEMWRPTAVSSLLRNAIYRGVYVRHGSAHSRIAARRAGMQVKPVEFARPEYRIVSDELWRDANRHSVDAGATGCRPAGTGKRLLSGLVSCGICHSTVTSGADDRSRSMHCQRCYLERRMGLIESWIGYTSEASAMQALHWALRQLLGPDVREDFSRMLRESIEAGSSKDVAALSRDVELAQARAARLKRALTHAELADDKDIIQALAIANREVREKSAVLARTQLEAESRDPAILERQLSVDLGDVLGALLDAPPDAAHLRAVLGRLIRRFAFVRHDRRHHAMFEIEFDLGGAVAEHSGTGAVTRETIAFQVEVTTSGHRPVRWHVTGELMRPMV